MSDRESALRVDSTGTVHPVGRVASQQLRARAGEFDFVPSPPELILMRAVRLGETQLRIAGEIRSPGALCDVVALAAQSNWVGELVVVTAAGSRAFFFERGALVGAQTTIPEERLGEMLMRFGVLDKAELERVVAHAQGGKRLGEAAIELELIKAEDLYPMMARQVEEVFYAALQSAAGAFYFFDRFNEESIGRKHNLNAGGLLMEGARRMDEMGFFRAKIPSDSFVPSATGAPGKRPPDELAPVYALCDGKRDVAGIGLELGMLEFEVTRAVFQLINAGLVQVNAPRPSGVLAIVASFNPALVLLHEACKAASREAELREGLSRFATGGGLYDPLFMGAGPLADGSFRPEAVLRNVAVLAGDDPDAWLVKLLYDYVGFGLFQAESLVARDTHARLIAQVMEALRPVQPLIDAGSGVW
jgi:hypothetical protein